MAEVSKGWKDRAKAINGGMENESGTSGLKAMWRRLTGGDTSASDEKPSPSQTPSPKPPKQKE